MLPKENAVIEKWSEKLIQETRCAIDSCFAVHQGVLHMKNTNRTFGFIRFENLVTKNLMIEEKTSDAVHSYPTVDALIEAGWAID